MRVIFFLLGLAFSALAVFMTNENYNFSQLSMATTGEVIDFYIETDIEDDDYYYPIVGFVSNQGEQYSFRASTGSSSPSYRIGDTVKVRYNLTNPFDAKFDSFLSLWGTSVLLVPISAFLFFLGFKYKANGAFIRLEEKCRNG